MRRFRSGATPPSRCCDSSWGHRIGCVWPANQADDTIPHRYASLVHVAVWITDNSSLSADRKAASDAGAGFRHDLAHMSNVVVEPPQGRRYQEGVMNRCADFDPGFGGSD